MCSTKVFNSISYRKIVFRKKLKFATNPRYFNVQSHSTKSPFSAVIPYGQGVTEEYRGFAKQRQLVCTHTHTEISWGRQIRSSNGFGI